MDKPILRYYKRKYRNGRSLVSRALDSAVMLFIFALASYLWFHANLGNDFLATTLSVIATFLFLAVMLLYRSISFEKFVKRHTVSLHDAQLLENLQLLDDKTFKSLIQSAAREAEDLTRKLVYPLRRTKPIEPDDVMHFYRKAQFGGAEGFAIVSTANFSKEAGALVARLPMDITLVGPARLMKLMQAHDACAVSQEDIHARILSLIAQEKKKTLLQSQAFTQKSALRYFICALILFGVSFISGYALYYRMLAGLCGLLSTTSLLLGSPTRQESVNM